MKSPEATRASLPKKCVLSCWLCYHSSFFLSSACKLLKLWMIVCEMETSFATAKAYLCWKESSNQRLTFWTTISIFKSHLGDTEPKARLLVFASSVYRSNGRNTCCFVLSKTMSMDKCRCAWHIACQSKNRDENKMWWDCVNSCTSALKPQYSWTRNFEARCLQTWSVARACAMHEMHLTIRDLWRPHSQEPPMVIMKISYHSSRKSRHKIEGAAWDTCFMFSTRRTEALQQS